MRQLIVGCIMVVAATGCAGSLGTVGKNQGWLRIEGDGKGWEKFASRDADLVNEAKTPGNMKSSNYQLKELKSNNWLESIRLKVRQAQEVGDNG